MLALGFTIAPERLLCAGVELAVGHLVNTMLPGASRFLDATTALHGLALYTAAVLLGLARFLRATAPGRRMRA